MLCTVYQSINVTYIYTHKVRTLKIMTEWYNSRFCTGYNNDYDDKNNNNVKLLSYSG